MTRASKSALISAFLLAFLAAKTSDDSKIPHMLRWKRKGGIIPGSIQSKFN